MVPAVIEFEFDPALHLGDLAVRWETLALALTIVICVTLAAVIAGRTSAVNAAYPEMGGRDRGSWHLRRDDLLYILLGVVPAAVLGGRLGYILIHWDFYSEHPDAWFDPTQGSLELSLAVVFGMVAGYAVAAGLGAPAGRWLHVAVVPTLLGLTVGKFIGVIGGTGQGAESNVDWSTAYLGPGPWGSLDPATPAHPSQLYEAVLSLLVLALIVYLLRLGRFRDRDGRVFFAGISLWALARVEASFTWRDPEVFGPFRAAQVIAIVIAVTYFGLFVLRAMYTGRTIRTILASRARVGRPATVPVAAAAAAGVAAAAVAGAGAGGGSGSMAGAVGAPANMATGVAPAPIAAAPVAASMTGQSEVFSAEEAATAAAARAAALRADEDARLAEEAAIAARMAALRAAEEARAAEAAALAAREAAARDAAVEAERAAAEAAARDLLEREAAAAALAGLGRATAPSRPGQVVALEQLTAAPAFVPLAPAFARSSRAGSVWFERLEAVPADEEALRAPAAPSPIATVPTAPTPVAPEPVTPEVAAPVPVARPVVAEPIAPEPVAPVPIVPEIVAPRPAPVPSWRELEVERLTPAAVGTSSEGVMTEQGEPRRRTARELLAMAEAARRAQAERAAAPAPTWTPAPVTPPTPMPAVVRPAARAEEPEPMPVVAAAATPSAPTAAVLVEQLEAETHVPVGIVGYDPLSPRGDLFTPVAVTGGAVIQAERLAAAPTRSEADTEPVEVRADATAPEPEAAVAAEPEPEPAAELEPVAAAEPEQAAESELAAEPEPVHMEIEEGAAVVAAASRLEDPLAPQMDLFEAMGERGDRFETPSEALTTPDLARAADRVALELEEARHAAALEPVPAPEPVAAPGFHVEVEAEPVVAIPEVAIAPEPIAAQPAVEVVAPEAEAPAPEPEVAAAEPEAVPAAEIAAPEPEAEAPAPEPEAEAPAPEPVTEPEAEAEGRRAPYRPPFRPVRPGRPVAPEAAPVAARVEVPAWEDEGERRRPYIPPRSRREYEERLRAEEEAARQAAEAPAWTARGQRLEAERDTVGEPEPMSLAAREHQRRMEREAEHRRMMRSRHAGRRDAEGAEGGEGAEGAGRGPGAGGV